MPATGDRHAARLVFQSASVLIADSGRLIAVAFPLTYARRSSGYAGQTIADCCGDFLSLAAGPLALVSGGVCQEIRPSAGLGADAAWGSGRLVLRLAGR